LAQNFVHKFGDIQPILLREKVALQPQYIEPTEKEGNKGAKEKMFIYQ
jgi:hypothetical protein